MKSNYDGAQNEYRIRETREGHFYIEKKKVRVKWGLFRDKIVEEWVVVNANGDEFESLFGYQKRFSHLCMFYEYREKVRYVIHFNTIEEARDTARQIIVDDRLFKDGFIIHPVEVNYQQF